MATAGMAPASALPKPNDDAMLVDKLPEEINEMKIKDEKVEKVPLHKFKDNLSPFFLINNIWTLVVNNCFSFLYHFSVIGNGSNRG